MEKGEGLYSFEGCISNGEVIVLLHIILYGKIFLHISMFTFFELSDVLIP